MRAPRALATSSTASFAVSFSRSRIGLTSTTSSEPTMPASAPAPSRGAPRGTTAAAHRRADPRRHLRVEHVHVEAECTNPSPDDVLERVVHRRLEPSPVEVAHREDASVQLARAARARRVERPHPDERDPAAARAPAAGRHHSRTPAREPERAASGMPWTFPLGEVSGRLRSPWASSQSTPPGRGRAPARRACRAHRVVAAEHEREVAVADRPATSSAIRSQVALICGR
jgi:hypothetical protein